MLDTDELYTADRRFLLLSSLLPIAGLALAAFRLGGQSLWLDETYTWWFSRQGWGDLLQAARIDAVNPPLYYFYVKLLAPSATEAALRLPSVLAYLGGVIGAIWLGFLLGGRPGGLAAGLLWATHPMSLWAARDARPYALSAFLAVAVAALFVRLQRSWSTPLGLLAGFTIALGLLTHYFFFVLAASLVLVAGIDLRRSPVFFRRWTLVVLLGSVPLFIWLAWLLSTGSPSLGIGWIRTPVLADIPLTIWNLASGYGGIAGFPSTVLGTTVLLVAGAGLSSSRSAWLKSFLAGVLIPILAVWTVSQRRPVYVDRYFIVLLPSVVSLVALGAADLYRSTLRRETVPAGKYAAVTAACLAALAAALTVHMAAKFQKEDWRSLATFLHSRTISAESLSLSEPEIALPLSYYFDSGMMTQRPRIIPDCGDSCWWVLRQPYTATHALTQSVQEPRSVEALAIPDLCQATDSWASETGLTAIHVVCSR